MEILDDFLEVKGKVEPIKFGSDICFKASNNKDFYLYSDGFTDTRLFCLNLFDAYHYQINFGIEEVTRLREERLHYSPFQRRLELQVPAEDISIPKGPPALNRTQREDFGRTQGDYYESEAEVLRRDVHECRHLSKAQEHPCLVQLELLHSSPQILHEVPFLRRQEQGQFEVNTANELRVGRFSR